MIASNIEEPQQKVYFPLRQHRVQAQESVGLLKLPLLCWDFKRHHMFLLVLKDPTDLDKLNHCKGFLLIWLLSVFQLPVSPPRKLDL